MTAPDQTAPDRPRPDEESVSFRPFVPAHATVNEFTPRALIVGTLLGILFGASSLYLVLKVGITVSASIPVAVISLTLFRLWSKFGGRDATILENNIVQTAGSGGESIAFGLGVTMPAIMILGFDLEISRVMLVGLLAVFRLSRGWGIKVCGVNDAVDLVLHSTGWNRWAKPWSPFSAWMPNSRPLDIVLSHATADQEDLATGSLDAFGEACGLQ